MKTYLRENVRERARDLGFYRRGGVTAARHLARRLDKATKLGVLGAVHFFIARADIDELAAVGRAVTDSRQETRSVGNELHTLHLARHVEAGKGV